jgi:hypothetical protein
VGASAAMKEGAAVRNASLAKPIAIARMATLLEQLFIAGQQSEAE